MPETVEIAELDLLPAYDAKSVHAAMLASAGMQAVEEAVVATGRMYREDDPVVIRRRRRGPRVELDDGGTAVDLAGRPAGWLETAERVVAQEGFNVNRAGVAFVQFAAGRDEHALAERLADCSVRVFSALLELEP